MVVMRTEAAPLSRFATNCERHGNFRLRSSTCRPLQQNECQNWRPRFRRLWSIAGDQAGRLGAWKTDDGCHCGHGNVELEEFSMDARSAQRGFARLISRISCRTSRGTLGLPGRRRDFQRQKPAESSTIAARLPLLRANSSIGRGPGEDPPEQIENLEHPAFFARFGRSGQADGICGRDSRWFFLR